jgi:hypothetical protein
LTFPSCIGNVRSCRCGRVAVRVKHMTSVVGQFIGDAVGPASARLTSICPCERLIGGDFVQRV